MSNTELIMLLSHLTLHYNVNINVNINVNMLDIIRASHSFPLNSSLILSKWNYSYKVFGAMLHLLHPLASTHWSQYSPI